MLFGHVLYILGYIFFIYLLRKFETHVMHIWMTDF